MLREKLCDFFPISLNNFTSFSYESSFNIFDLIVIILTHIVELLSHSLDQLINIIIFLLDGLDILFILVLELVNECLDENIFLFNDLFTSFLLNFNVSSKLLTIFFFFKFLPSPINFDIFLVTCNDFCLNFVGSFLSHLFFLNSSLVLEIISVGSDLCDDIICGTSNLL
jgi:hypothetical protein